MRSPIPVPALAAPLSSAARPAPVFFLQSPIAGVLPISLPHAAAFPAVAPVPVFAAASERAPESAAVDASARFDGALARPETPAAVVQAPAPDLGSGLRAAQPEHSGWLSAAVKELSRTRTGRRVLRDIDLLAASRGRPTLLVVKQTSGNSYAEFHYDTDLVIVDVKYLKRDPKQTAPTLAHELQHVLQFAAGLPAFALELELESFTIEGRIWNELGIKPHDDDAHRLLMEDVPRFIKWLIGVYGKQNILLHGSTIDAYAERIDKMSAASKATEARNLRRLAAAERIIQSMRDNGMSEEAIATHRRQEIEPIERRLRINALERKWVEHDMKLLSSAEGRARMRAYSRSVIRRAYALSRSSR